MLEYVGQVIARGVPGGVWVRAEIASLTDRRHLYLDLVQAGEGAGIGREQVLREMGHGGVRIRVGSVVSFSGPT